jgi:hypothetical protein
MITVLIMNVIFWVVNFKTQSYFVIFLLHRTFTSGYLCTIALILLIFGISELQTVQIDCQNDKNRKWGYDS